MHKDWQNEAGELGDVSPAVFREQLHQLADWIVDYRANIEQLPVGPTAEAGAISRHLPKKGPEHGEPFEKIFADFQNIILPGVLHWGHPQFTAYFGSTSTAPGLEGEILASALNINAMKPNVPISESPGRWVCYYHGTKLLPPYFK